MKYYVLAGALGLMAAGCATPAAIAHDDTLRAAENCAPVSTAAWNQVRNGMTLDQVEHVLGCRATHMQTNEFRTFTSDIYMFERGSEHLASVAIRDGVVWRKRMH